MKNVSVLKVSLWLTTLAGIYGCQEQNLSRLPKPPTNDTVKVQIAFTPLIIRMDQSGKPMISIEDSPMIKGPDIIL